MFHFIIHTLFLAVAVVVAFLWTSSPALSYYTLQLIAVFILLFFLNQFRSRRGGATPPHSRRINQTIDAVIFTMVVLLLVTSTGGLKSPVFFLLYFLMFGLSLLLEPAVSLSLSVAMFLLFFLSPSSPNPTEDVLQLFSLILITPLALFFDHQYLKLLEEEDKIKILQDEEKITQNLIAEKKKNVFLWTSLELKKYLTTVLNEISEMLADVSHLNFRQQERLYKICKQLLKLIKSSEELKEETENEY